MFKDLGAIRLDPRPSKFLTPESISTNYFNTRKRCANGLSDPWNTRRQCRRNRKRPPNVRPKNQSRLAAIGPMLSARALASCISMTAISRRISKFAGSAFQKDARTDRAAWLLSNDFRYSFIWMSSEPSRCCAPDRTIHALGDIENSAVPIPPIPHGQVHRFCPFAMLLAGVGKSDFLPFIFLLL
jgi:hypothetical protein